MTVQKKEDYELFKMKSSLFKTAFLESIIFKVISALKYGPMTQ